MNITVTLFGQSIAFFLFVVFTMKYVWPPIINALEKRKKTIADGLAAGEKGHQELDLAQQRFAEMVQEGKKKAADIITQAQKRHDEIVEEAKVAARKESEWIREGARSEIEQEKEIARQGLRQQVAELALQGAEQVLMREVDRKVHNDVLNKISAGL
ncbi:MAG: F0F1 ATP synthase subunit B [Gammaproteobacteria bacterium]